MDESSNDSGHFTTFTLHPVVTISGQSMIEKSNELYEKANQLCFITNLKFVIDLE